MTDTIAIRKKVAALCGFTDINWYSEPFHTLLKGFKFGLQVPVPKYDTSLDAIAEAFNDHKFSYTLSKCISEETNELLGYFAIGGGQSAFGATAPKALCYLFIKLMEANKKALLN